MENAVLSSFFQFLCAFLLFRASNAFRFFYSLFLITISVDYFQPHISTYDSLVKKLELIRSPRKKSQTKQQLRSVNEHNIRRCHTIDIFIHKNVFRLSVDRTVRIASLQMLLWKFIWGNHVWLIAFICA